MPQIEYQCCRCHENLSREVPWYEPDHFSGKPQMTLAFWCPSCEAPLKLVIKFKKNNCLSLETVVDYILSSGNEPEITAQPVVTK